LGCIGKDREITCKIIYLENYLEILPGKITWKVTWKITNDDKLPQNVSG
jgi:hypothetical protein